MNRQGVKPGCALLSAMSCALFATACDSVLTGDNGTCGPSFSGDPSAFGPYLAPNMASMEAGDSQQFELMYHCCSIPPIERPASNMRCVEWTVDPPEMGTIDAHGMFQLSQNAQHGDSCVVTASFPGSLGFASVVTVFDRDLNPLVGTWRERHGLSCDDPGNEVAGSGFIAATFRADGTFVIVWGLGEAWEGYLGSYTYDSEGKQIDMTTDWPAPSDGDFSGTVEVLADDAIALYDMFLAEPSPVQPEVPVCGHVLEPNDTE